MFGAIYGDVIGSYYEWHGTKDYDFPFEKESCFTDDSAMTAAVCRAILDDPAEITRSGIDDRALEYAANYKLFYARYPYAGYGQMFSAWARESGMTRRRSYGNGGAMRVAPIGYAYGTLEQVLLQAEASCLYTHRHREAIDGAQAVAAAVWMADRGADKEEIRAYLKKQFRYPLDRTVEDIRPGYRFEVRTGDSVPQAIVAFLDSADYESAVRNAVSLGGDADTQACIAGAIAEAYYREIPDGIRRFCRDRIDAGIRATVKEFEERFPPARRD